MEENFTKQEIEQITAHKISFEKMKQQLHFLKNDVPKVTLNRPATINDGLQALSEEEANHYAKIYESKKENLKIKKFVPASGAASRMFKFLSEFITDFKLGEESINAYINRKNDKNLPVFLVAKEKLPFYIAVLQRTKELYADYHNWSKDLQDYSFIKTLLDTNEFNFANKPKGILPFHQYENFISTPIEEHLKECVSYANSNEKAHLQFTVSKEHEKEFEKIISSIKPKIEKRNNITIYVKYSYQDNSTDSIAVDLNYNLFRDENKNLVFRPGGHGALIENLNQLNCDLLFIKNIDNVIQNHTNTIALYKKALAGILLELQSQIFGYLSLIKSNAITENSIDEIVAFAKRSLNIEIIDDFDKYTFESKKDYLIEILNRPIRVCGMVKNEGEPGGGPFWVEGSKGKISLQIVETSQVDTNNKAQKTILDNATHFNPVDLVCGINDFEGNKFDLSKYVNPNRGFIVEKNKNGKPYKAFELPGLWNGAMAKWITIFVEVPLITFNPVKTVNDLLKPAHQPAQKNE